MSLEQFLASISKEDLKRLNEEYYKKQNKIPTYQYSKIRDIELESLVDIEKIINKSKFTQWFEKNTNLSEEIVSVFLFQIKSSVLMISPFLLTTTTSSLTSQTSSFSW